MLVAGACTDTAPSSDQPPQSDQSSQSDGSGTAADAVDAEGFELGPAPSVPDTIAIDAATERHLEDLVVAVGQENFFIPQDAVDDIVGQGDPRFLWLLADLLRFTQDGPTTTRVADAFERLAGKSLRPGGPGATWRQVTDHLIGWDLEAPPDYREWKRRILIRRDGRWDALFADADDLVDWRHVTWGGVHMDRRELGDPDPCIECIPALDDPAVTPAVEGDWYGDDQLVFGIVVDGEARAYPRNILAVHELVNDTLGGRRIGIPYCTLCGSAQAYFTDRFDEAGPAAGDAGSESALVLRTSGLLIRSNKLMFDLDSDSVIDTFRGVALSGPLRQRGVSLEPVTVVTSTWGAWKEAHPETTIVAADGGIGRSYGLNPLGGRDSDGPTFAVGDVDPRLTAQAEVLGVVGVDGTAVAFPVERVRAELLAGRSVAIDDVVVELDGDGLVAGTGDGRPIPSHQSYWFAWSQFRPDTELWDG